MPATISATFDTGGAPHATPLTNITDLMSNLVNSTTTPSAQAKLAKHRKGNGKSLQHSTAPPPNWHSTPHTSPRDTHRKVTIRSDAGLTPKQNRTGACAQHTHGHTPTHSTGATPTHSIGAPPAHSTGKGASPNTTAAAIKQQLQAPQHPGTADEVHGRDWVTVTRRRPNLDQWTLRSKDWSDPIIQYNDLATALSKHTDGSPFRAVIQCADEDQGQAAAAMLNNTTPKAVWLIWRLATGTTTIPGQCGTKPVLQRVRCHKLVDQGQREPALLRCTQQAITTPRNTPKHSASSSTSNTSATKHGSQHWNAPAKHWETGSKRSPPPRQQPYRTRGAGSNTYRAPTKTSSASSGWPVRRARHHPGPVRPTRHLR